MAVLFFTNEGTDIVGSGAGLVMDETELKPDHIELDFSHYVETTLEEVKERVAICAGALAVDAA